MGKLAFIILILSISPVSTLLSQSKIIKELDAKAWAFRKTFPDSTLYYTNRIIENIRANGDTSHIAKYYNYKGLGYYYKGDNYTSFTYYMKAYKAAEQLGDTLQHTYAMNNLGRFFLSQGNYLKAYDYSRRALEAFSQMNYPDGIAYSFKRISEIYVAQGYLDQALTASKKALKIRIDIFDEGTQSTAHYDLAYVYLQMDSVNMAFKNFQLARDKALTINAQVLVANSELGLSDLYIKSSDYDSAIVYAKNAKAVAVQLENQDLLSRALIHTGKAYFYASKLRQAKVEFEEVLESTDVSNQLEFQRDAYFFLARINARLNKGMKAFEYQLQYNGLNSKLDNTQDKRAIDSLLFENEIEQKANENELLTLNKKKDQELIELQRWQNNLMLIAILSIVIVLIIIYRNSKKAQKINEELTDRNNQINIQKEELKATLEQKLKLENELINTNQKLQAILNSGYVSIISTDTQGIITHFSKGAENLLGYKSSEMVGVNTPALIHDEKEVIERGKSLSKAFDKEVSGFDVFVTIPEIEEFESREWTYIKKNGKRFPVQLVVSAMRDKESNLTGYLGIATDITQQKKNEAKLITLIKENIHYKDILENVEDIVYQLDGNTNYTYVNPATCRLTGYSEIEMYSKNYMDLIPDSYKEQVKDFYTKQVQNQDKSTANEFPIFTKNGDLIWIRQSTRMFFNKNGSINRVFAVAQNINEIHELRARLDSQNEIYKLLSENSQDLVALHDIDGKYLYVSPSVKRLLGYDPSNLIGKNPYDYIHPEDHIKLQEGPHQKSKGGISTSNIEYRLKSKAGKYVWFEAYTAPVFNDKKEVMSFQTSSRDISERKRIEAKVKKSEANLKGLIENTTDIIYSVDNNYKLITLNKAFKKGFDQLYGIKLRTGVKIDKVYEHKKSREQWIKNINKAKSGERLITTVVYNRSDGRTFYYENYYNPILDDDEVIGVAVFGRDVTTKKKEEEKVKRYQEGLRLINGLASTTDAKIDELLESALSVVCHYLKLPLGIISEIKDTNYKVRNFHSAEDTELNRGQVFDLSNTYCDLTILNNKVTAISDMSTSEYYGHPCYNSFKLESYIGAIIYVDSKFYGTVNFSSAIKRKEPFDDLDEDFMVLFANWIGAILQRNDVSIRLKKEKDKAEQASQAKAEFLSVMSHEIRTPLNGILGLTNILLQETPRKDQVKNLNLLKFSGDNLLVIINDILDFNKIEAGKIELEKVDFNLFGILDSIRQTNQFKSEDKGIRLELNYDSQLPKIFIGDSVRIGQVINNLVSNAIKFTSKGTVTIDCKQVKSTKKYAQILFKVIDTGKGIDNTKFDKIFERFGQEEDSTTREYGGTGLGLPITKKLLNLMGSDINVDSKLGEGTTFSFTLELPLGDDSLLKNTQAEDLNFMNLDAFDLTILIAEDNDINYKIASKYLSQWNVKTEQASDGEQAIEKVKKGEYDMVLMDLQMPKVNGYDATRAIRKFNSNIPILALTASVLEEVRVKAKDAGMCDFIAKPMTPHELYDKVTSNLKIIIDSQNTESKMQQDSLATEVESTNQIADGLEKMSMGDKDFLKELIDLYCISLDELEKVLIEASESNNEEQARNIAHKVKSTIVTLGLNSIQTTIDYIIESIVKKSTSVNGHVSTLKSQIQSVKRNLLLLKEDTVNH